MRPNSTHFCLAASLAVAALCATRVARAQSEPDASAPPTQPSVTAPSRWLAPPSPDGGVYAPPSATTPAPQQPGATGAPSSGGAAAPSATLPVTIGGSGVTTTTTTPPPANGAGAATTPSTTTTTATPPPPPGTAGAVSGTAGVTVGAPAATTTVGGVVITPGPGAAVPTAGVLTGQPAVPRRPSLIRERLRLLNTALPPLAARSRTQRILDGVISLVLGTGIGALSFAIPPSTGPGDLRPWFWVTAGVSIVTGTLTLAWAPARETLTAQFERMPMETARQRRLRVMFGERALEDMAADGARRRTLSALGNSAVSLAMLAIIYRDPIFNGTPYTFSAFDAIVIGVSGLSVVTSLLQLFGRSEEERLRESYWQQVRILRAERGIDAQAH